MNLQEQINELYRKLRHIRRFPSIDGNSGKAITTDGDKLIWSTLLASPQVQTDWNQSDNGQEDFIKNKPILGTAAALNTGTSANNVVKVGSGGKLPALDGSLLTNLPSPIGTPTLQEALTEGNDAGGITITNLPEPINDTEAATKKYVDDNAGGVSLPILQSPDLTLWLIGLNDAGALQTTQVGTGTPTTLSLFSPDNTEYEVTVSNEGALITTAI